MNSKRVLICEDDEGIIELAEIVLEEAGYNVVTEMNSQNIYNVIERVKPDLLLVDLWLPGISGDVITRHLKEQESTKNLIIIVMSANKDTEKIAHDAGADAFLAKPFDIAALEAIVTKYLAK
jgi:two-component system, OmpR family, alkaline phosphatase synthesis response regulator PhoP